MKINLRISIPIGMGAMALLLFFNTQSFSQALWQANGSGITYTNRWVGIGTTTPTQKLDVAGRMHASGNAYFDSLAQVLSLKAGNISINSNLITSSTGAISFGNNNLSTAGNISGANITASGGLQGTTLTVTNNAAVSGQLTTSSITSPSGTVDFAGNNLITTGNVTAASIKFSDGTVQTTAITNQPSFDNVFVINRIKVGSQSLYLGTGSLGTSNSLWTDNGPLTIQSESGNNNNTIINASAGTLAIGTATPNTLYKLHVSGGSIRLDQGGIAVVASNTQFPIAGVTSTSNTFFLVSNTGQTAAGVYMIGGGTGTKGVIIHATGPGNYQGASKLVFRTTDSTDIYCQLLDGAGKGNLGLGTLNPLEKLDVNGNALFSGSVGIGSETIPIGVKLAVCGTIQSTEWIVTTPWCDFKFEPTYQRMTWQEKLAYIKTNKHLPEIESGKEIEINGLQAGKTMRGFIWNIEDNTLDIIDLQKENEMLKNKNSELEKRIEALEKN
ncbi:MAG: hypothetical protein HY840_08705 [Bacteroidetes bacterium]|nr:hypothetical protein [Bacteroidota bacterium]